MRIMLIGPLPPPLGGTTVSFDQLVKELLSLESVFIEVIDTSRERSNSFISNILTVLNVTFKLLMEIKKVDVVTFHASFAGTVYYGPFLYLISKMFKKPFILREFGGDFDIAYQNSSLMKKISVRLLFGADCILLQTQSLIRFFEKKIPDRVCRWFPNSRRLVASDSLNKNSVDSAKNFIYVGQVKPTKGIREIIAAANSLPDHKFNVDIYGPLMDGITEQDFGNSEKVKYRGILQNNKIISTIMKYDVLLLPTYHYGEGYPGVILEAYSAGVPVIATEWLSIPEIVEDGVSGLLIPPKDVDALASAMKSLLISSEKIQFLRIGAKKQAQRFSSDEWTRVFVRICNEVLQDYKKRRP